MRIKCVTILVLTTVLFLSPICSLVESYKNILDTTSTIKIGGYLLLATPEGIFKSNEFTQGKTNWQRVVEGPIKMAALSPNGLYIAYVKSDQSRLPITYKSMDTIYIFDLAKNKLLTSEKNENEIVSLDWSPDSSSIVYLSGGNQKALFQKKISEETRKLLEARFAFYTQIVPSTAGPFFVWGHLEFKWIAKNVLLLQEFGGSFPKEITGLEVKTEIEADRTSFFHIDKGKKIEIPLPNRYYLISAIPPGEGALFYDQNGDWYIASLTYFWNLDEHALTKIDVCSKLDCNLDHSFIPAPSVDDRYLVIRVGKMGENYLEILDLKSHQNKLLNETNIKGVAFPSSNIESVAWVPSPSSSGLAVLSADWSGNSTISVLIMETNNSVILDTLPGYKNILAFGWIPGNPSSIDADNDGLSDVDEIDKHGTNPYISDSDGDGLDDKTETDMSTNPNSTDTDKDGLNDGGEVEYGTNPFIADTDEDGLDDGAEVAKNTDPTKIDTDGDFWNDFSDMAPKSILVPNGVLVAIVTIIVGVAFYRKKKKAFPKLQESGGELEKKEV